MYNLIRHFIINLTLATHYCSQPWFKLGFYGIIFIHIFLLPEDRRRFVRSVVQSAAVAH